MSFDDATGTIKLLHAFGARSMCQNLHGKRPLPKPLHFIEDTSTLMYTVGRRVVVHNLEKNTMLFMPENDRLEVTYTRGKQMSWFKVLSRVS